MSLFSILVSGAFALVGYLTTRNYVRVRLRYVDAVQKPLAPLIAGGIVALLAAPVVWLCS